jgi:23S rRNA pseudouridine1911/1915/1917 synthase
VPAKKAIVPPTLAGPLDRAVRGLFGTSWGKARGWIATGKVTVAGALATQDTALVETGQAIAIDEQARRPRPNALSDDQIVYVDAHLVVALKPAGISTVAYDETEVDTLDARVRAWLERQPSAKGGRPNLGVVHRIDKDTSGLVVFTRTWLAKTSLSGQFRRHTVLRKYLAIAGGAIRSTRTFHTWLVVDRGDGLRGSARKTVAGAREAITHVEPVELLPGATLVACRLRTGRTHQIRIHLSEAGHPLLGERVYIRKGPAVVPPAPRLMLHAAELGFAHPVTERSVRWEAPLPSDMEAVLRVLRVHKPPER